MTNSSEGKFRVLDTGVLEGRLNIAIGQAIIERHQQGLVADTLRFLRFPPTALVGRHQALGQEIDLEYCAENEIGVARRITGGGAIFMEPGLLGWELVFDRRSLGINSLPELTRAICQAAADGITRLGVPARFRPRNDIEVDGRKISGTGGFFDGNTLFFQGTVLVDMNPEVMVNALRVPQAKLAKRALDSAQKRVVTLRELMGESTPDLPFIQQSLTAAFAEHFGRSVFTESLSEAERELAQRLFYEEIGTDDFVNGIDEPVAASGDLSGTQTAAGGVIKAHLRLQGPAQNLIRAALFSGDFFVTPPRVIFDLESHLRGVYLDDVENVVSEFFEDAGVEVLSVSPDDFIAAIQDALGRS